MPEHYPVMLGEVLHYLEPRPDGIYLDCTAGLFGHTAAIASRLTTGFVIAADRDAESLQLGYESVAHLRPKIRPLCARFSELPERLKELHTEKVDGLLADLGASRYQLTSPQRGFSFSADGPLDMRFDQSQRLTAADIVNRYSERQLARLLWELGQERRARTVARAIVRARPLHTTGQLAQVVEQAVRRAGRIHPATRTFMALRIAVNDELEELDALLGSLPALVKPGGRAVIISFHSLEDRRVKRAFQSLARRGLGKILTRHVVKPTPEEVKSNPPSRSARLRAIELLEQDTNAAAIDQT